jgi:hypothetical protein
MKEEGESSFFKVLKIANCKLLLVESISTRTKHLFVVFLGKHSHNFPPTYFVMLFWHFPTGFCGCYRQEENAKVSMKIWLLWWPFSPVRNS